MGNNEVALQYEAHQIQPFISRRGAVSTFLMLPRFFWAQCWLVQEFEFDTIAMVEGNDLERLEQPESPTITPHVRLALSSESLPVSVHHPSRISYHRGEHQKSTKKKASEPGEQSVLPDCIAVCQLPKPPP